MSYNPHEVKQLEEMILNEFGIGAGKVIQFYIHNSNAPCVYPLRGDEYYKFLNDIIKCEGDLELVRIIDEL